MDWKRLLLKADDSILDALRTIDSGSERFAMVVDDTLKLLGVVTDGNIRRALMSGAQLDSPISRAMNPAPVTAKMGTAEHSALKLMQQRGLTHLPVLDSQGVLTGVFSEKRLRNASTLPYPAVIMVGGLGTRLGELTRDCPKPMLPVGGKPLLETVLLNLVESGIRNFYFAVNYLAGIIESHFGDGGAFGVRINYLREKKPMGTAGALSLLPQEAKTLPVLVMNGDILTRLHVAHLFSVHESSGAPATLVVKKHEVQLPYGVVDADEEQRLLSIQEKPLVPFHVSAGIYILGPEALERIPKNRHFDMPELFGQLVQSPNRPYVFEHTEYWLDIGRIGDFQKANTDFGNIFS